MSGARVLPVAAILTTFLVAGALYIKLTPKWQAPDEPAHYNYIRYLAIERGFPELTANCYDQQYLDELTSRRFPPELSIHNVCYEFHQPPLYYLLAVPMYVLSNGSLVALRSVSLALGAGVVLLAFFAAQTIFPNKPALALGTMAFVAFVPMHVAILSSVNNDALAELILAALLLLMIRRIVGQKIVTIWDDLLLGLILGVGLLTKTTVYIAIPLIVATMWLTEVAEAGGKDSGLTKLKWVRVLKHGTVTFGLALIVAIPWYVRNAVLYGGLDILGLARHDEIVVGQLRTVDLLAEVGRATYLSNFVTTTFRSFWGQFGWMAVPMDRRTYLLLALLSLMALGGLIAFLVAVSSAARSSLQLSPNQRQGLGLLALAVLLMLAAYGWYNLTFVQFQGRYLFPGLIPLGVFFALGLIEALNRKWAWWLVGGLVLVLVWVIGVSMLTRDLDKWLVLSVGLALGLVTARIFVERHWKKLTAWFLAACYISLSLLTLISPFWFVAPYL